MLVVGNNEFSPGFLGAAQVFIILGILTYYFNLFFRVNLAALLEQLLVIDQENEKLLRLRGDGEERADPTSR